MLGGIKKVSSRVPSGSWRPPAGCNFNDVVCHRVASRCFLTFMTLISSFPASSGLVSAVPCSWSELPNSEMESLRIPPVWKHDEHITIVWKPKACLLHHFPPPFLAHSSLHALTDPSPLVYLLCLRQQAVFAERLSARRPARQPLLTSDPSSPTCPPGHTHTLFTNLVLLALSTSDVKGISVSADWQVLFTWGSGRGSVCACLLSVEQKSFENHQNAV